MSLDDIFGGSNRPPIENIPVVEVIHTDDKVTIVPPEGTEEDVDYDFVRANHYKLAAQTTEAMEIALKVLRASEHPDAVKALSQLLKTSSEVNRQLLLLSKDKAETKTAKGAKQTSSAPQTTISAQQVVFTGSSSELSKILDAEDEPDNE